MKRDEHILISSYTLESYIINTDPIFIAMEAAVNAMGTNELSKDEMELIAAIRRKDAEAAEEIKGRIDARIERARKKARREKNKQIADACLGYLATAASVASMIYGLRGDRKIGRLRGAVQSYTDQNKDTPVELQKALSKAEDQLANANRKLGMVSFGTNVARTILRG